jgi:cyclohexyl-isocyanide hydratase
MATTKRPCQIGLLLFPGMTQLDFTGPYEVFARLPDAAVHTVSRALGPVKTDRGLVLMPTVTYDDCPQLDVVVVPGGPGQQQLMEDEATHAFLRRQAAGARYVTSVCTGALVLGAAGLLTGYRATTHWLSLPLLSLLGATPVDARVVVDRDRITGGGMTAGIDFGLSVAALLYGDDVAQRVQLQMEYEPEPPFHGSPATAPAEIVAAVRRDSDRFQAERRASCEKAAQRLAKPA